MTARKKRRKRRQLSRSKIFFPQFVFRLKGRSHFSAKMATTLPNLKVERPNYQHVNVKCDTQSQYSEFLNTMSFLHHKWRDALLLVGGDFTSRRRVFKIPLSRFLIYRQQICIHIYVHWICNNENTFFFFIKLKQSIFIIRT